MGTVPRPATSSHQPDERRRISMTLHPASDDARTPAPGRPTIVLGGNPSALGSATNALTVSQIGPFYALDLDLRESWLPPTWDQFASHAAQSTVRLRSLWLPATLTGFNVERRHARITDLLAHGRDKFGLRDLIVPRLSADTPGINLAAEARAFTKASSGIVRIAIGIRAATVMRHADHLDRIAAIRRTIEEWDLGVALDLTGDIPPGWEAEAAIARLVRRMSLIRLEPWLLPTGQPNLSPAGQLAARSLAMLADQGYTGIISLHTIGGGIIERARTNRAAAHSQLLYDDVLRRFTPTAIDDASRAPRWQTQQRHVFPEYP
ncbi:MAG: hypothetical protein QM589_11950 [Thermomicrobiales bacterium]